MSDARQCGNSIGPNRFSVRMLFSGGRPSKDDQLVSSIRRKAAALRSIAEYEFVELTNQLRRDCRGAISGRICDPSWITLAGGLAVESLRRVHAIDLYDVQLRAGLAMCGGRIAEMQTGEGKTYSGLLPTFVYALAGRGVHVCTPNAYLASRDHEILCRVFELLGVTTAVRNEHDSFDAARNAYGADVTYAAGQLFGFDYLRDQWTMRQATQDPLGKRTTDALRGVQSASKLRGRGLFAAVIDEADHVLVDDAVSPLLITSSAELPAPDTELHLAAKAVSSTLTDGVHYSVDGTTGAVQLTDAGFQAVYENDECATSELLSRPWHSYVLSSLKAKHQLGLDRHYVIRDRKIQIVEMSTGRIFADRTWSDGLHQAVQAKENLRITAETESQGRITRQAFFQRYEHLCGMTGTAQDCRQELFSIYGLGIQAIATRLPSRRQVLPLLVCCDQEAKLQRIAEEVIATRRDGRAILVGTNHIDQSNAVSETLRRLGIACSVLNGTQDDAEAALIAGAGRVGAVTVATHLAGRGTDIPLEQSVVNAGGLHVIVSEHHRLTRVDRQLIGRGARQGDPGTARFFVAPDDEFVVNHAPYLAASIMRCDDSSVAVEALSRSIRAAQRRLEAEDRGNRFQLMKKSQKPMSALSPVGVSTLSANRSGAGIGETLGRFLRRAS